MKLPDYSDKVSKNKEYDLYAGRPTAKSKSTPPKNVNKNIKVSQSEINQIKKLGMKKALQIAAMNKDSEQKGAVASFGEGVRRLYGETRYQNAIYTPKASPGPIGSAPSSKSNFTYTAPKADKVKSNSANSRENRVATSKPKAKTRPLSIGEKIEKGFKGAGKSLKKAYQGK